MNKSGNKYPEIAFPDKLINLPWFFVIMVSLISCIGIALLYSAAQGNMEPWASRQLSRLITGLALMIIVALIDIRFWHKIAYLGYLAGLGLLVLVYFKGTVGGLGAQRWLNIGGVQFQPSEVMKVFLVLALARYFNGLHPNNINRFTILIIPLILTGISAFLVLKQPNLGTASIMIFTAGIIVFMAGVSWKKFALAGILALAAIPLIWANMHDYQKKRVEIFLNPESDPLGSGYNIIQSKIAIGSGGFWGKGFVRGTQGQLSFVPEKHTDFIFSIVAEEFGLVGAITLISLYAILIIYGILLSSLCQNEFGRLAGIGIISIMFLHVFVNIGMVSGMLPVVGVPLPLLSYGGTSMLSTLGGLGLIMNAYIYKKKEL